MSTDNNKKEYNGNEFVAGDTLLNEKISKTTGVENNDKKEVKEEITLTKDNEESKRNNINIIEIKENKEEKKEEKEKTETVTNVKENTILKDGNEEEENGEEDEASQIMKFLASAVPSEDFKTSIKNELKDKKVNEELSQIFDLGGNIRIKAFGDIPQSAQNFLGNSNEGKKILRAINVLKVIFVALSDKSVKFGQNGIGKTLTSILKGWGVEHKPNDETVIEVSKILASIKLMGGLKPIGSGFKLPEKNSKKYKRIMEKYHITEEKLVQDFINKNKSLGNLFRAKLNFSEDQKSQILENAIVDRSLDEETLDKIVALFKTIGSSPEIGDVGDVVKNEILSRSKELDEKTTLKVPFFGMIYNAVASSYTFSAKVLQKIVNGYGDITFNVFLINDEEFNDAMRAFEDICLENNNDVAFGNLLKMIKILRICANQKDNQMAKKFKGYAEEHNQMSISTLFSGNFLLNFIPDSELKDNANSSSLESDFSATRLFFSNFEFSKEDIGDVEKCVPESGVIIHNNEIFYEVKESGIGQSEIEGVENIVNYEHESVVITPDSNNKNMAIIEIPGSLGKIELNVSLTKTLDYQAIVSFDQKEFKERKLQVLQLISEEMIGSHNLLEGTTGSEISKIANGMENKFQEQTVRQVFDEYANIIILTSLFNQYSPEVKISSIKNLTFYPSDEFKKNPLFASVVKQFSQARPMLSQLSQLVTENNIIMEERTEVNAKEQKKIGTKKMLENTIANQSLNKEELDKIVDFLSTIINSNQEISNGVKNEILSRKEKLDEETTSDGYLWNFWNSVYRRFFPPYSSSAKTLQKIVNEYGDITFNVFLIDDKEFEVAMEAFEKICQENKNDLAFGNLLKMIKILRICANQKDNQMAEKFKGYAEEHKQTAIITLFSGNFFLNFIPGSELKDNANSSSLESDFSDTRLFFGNFEFSKKDIEDIEKLVLLKEKENKEEIKENKKEDKKEDKIEDKKEEKTEENKEKEKTEENKEKEKTEDKKEEKTEDKKEEKTEDKKEEKTEENKEEVESKSVSIYSDLQNHVSENKHAGLGMGNKPLDASEIDETHTNILKERSHGELGTKYRLPGTDRLRADQEMDLENLNLSSNENKQQKKKKNKAEEKRENEEDKQNQEENENNNKHDLNRSADNILADQNRHNFEENSSSYVDGDKSTVNTTYQSLVSKKQIEQRSEKESHVLRRIGVVLLGLVIAALFAAALTFALAAIPGIGPVIGGILGKTFVDAATLSIGSVVPLGWVVGGIGALGTTIGGVFLGKNIKTLWTSECVEESKKVEKVEEDNDKEEEVKEEDENIGHDWVTSLLQKDYEADVEESETESKIESREQQNPIVKSSFCKKFGKLSDQDKKTIHKPLTESPVFFRNTEVKFKGGKKQNQDEK